MKIREKINILLSLLISMLGMTSCRHARIASDSEIMLMYGVPTPDDITLDSMPSMPADSAQAPTGQPSVQPKQPKMPPIMVKYGVPPQLRNN